MAEEIGAREFSTDKRLHLVRGYCECRYDVHSTVACASVCVPYEKEIIDQNILLKIFH